MQPFDDTDTRQARGIADAVRELDAAKARVERDAAAAASAMKRKLVEELLPVVDSLERMAASSTDEGAALVHAQLLAILRGYGVTRIDALEARFDPAIHEAVALAPSNGAYHGIVVDQVSAGYRYGETLLRPARVVVGRLAA